MRRGLSEKDQVIRREGCKRVRVSERTEWGGSARA